MKGKLKLSIHNVHMEPLLSNTRWGYIIARYYLDIARIVLRRIRRLVRTVTPRHILRGVILRFFNSDMLVKQHLSISYNVRSS